MKPMDQELKNMFGQTPDSFNLAIERALAGEKPARETPAPRRLNKTWSIVLIVALALAMTAVAYAAAVRMGLIDFIDSSGYIGPIPEAALEVLQNTSVQSWEIGPVTVSLNETIADSHLTYVVCQARMTDGSDALFYNWDWMDTRIPDALRERLGLEGEWLTQAAAAYDGPIYSAQMRLELDPAFTSGDEMELDPVYGSDGSLLNAYMVGTDPSAIGETVAGQLRIDLRRVEVTNAWEDSQMLHWDSEVVESWTEFFPIEIPVTGVLETKTYLPVEEADLGWGTLERVDVERTPAGAYAYIRVLVNDPSIIGHMIEFGLRDGNGEPLPRGIYPSSGFDGMERSMGTWLKYFGADELPEALMVRHDGKTFKVQ